MELASNNIVWDETAFLTMTSGVGDLAGLAVEVADTCVGACTALEPAWGGEVVEGAVVEGALAYEADVPANGQVAADTEYTFTFEQPGTVPIESAFTTGPG